MQNHRLGRDVGQVFAENTDWRGPWTSACYDICTVRGGSMNRLLWTAAMLLCLGTPCLAQIGGGGQGTDDHDDAAPTQVGYAVVTAASSATGLTVMETFGLKDGTEINRAGFPSPELVT